MQGSHHEATVINEEEEEVGWWRWGEVISIFIHFEDTAKDLLMDWMRDMREKRNEDGAMVCGEATGRVELS